MDTLPFHNIGRIVYEVVANLLKGLRLLRPGCWICCNTRERVNLGTDTVTNTLFNGYGEASSGAMLDTPAR
jgi:hypothetical protein